MAKGRLGRVPVRWEPAGLQDGVDVLHPRIKDSVRGYPNFDLINLTDLVYHFESFSVLEFQFPKIITMFKGLSGWQYSCV